MSGLATRPIAIEDRVLMAPTTDIGGPMAAGGRGDGETNFDSFINGIFKRSKGMEVGVTEKWVIRRLLESIYTKSGLQNSDIIEHDVNRLGNNMHASGLLDRGASWVDEGARRFITVLEAVDRGSGDAVLRRTENISRIVGSNGTGYDSIGIIEDGGRIEDMEFIKKMSEDLGLVRQDVDDILGVAKDKPDLVAKRRPMVDAYSTRDLGAVRHACGPVYARIMTSDDALTASEVRESFCALFSAFAKYPPTSVTEIKETFQQVSSTGLNPIEHLKTLPDRLYSSKS